MHWSEKLAALDARGQLVSWSARYPYGGLGPYIRTLRGTQPMLSAGEVLYMDYPVGEGLQRAQVDVLWPVESAEAYVLMDRCVCAGPASIFGCALRGLQRRWVQRRMQRKLAWLLRPVGLIEEALIIVVQFLDKRASTEAPLSPRESSEEGLPSPPHSPPPGPTRVAGVRPDGRIVSAAQAAGLAASDPVVTVQGLMS